MNDYKVSHFPKTRIATKDICAIGLKKHHIAALVEIDVTASREKITRLQQENKAISFTAWLIKVISTTIKDHEQVAAYLEGKSKTIVFTAINVSLAVEREINGHKVPIPLVIEKANERSIESISQQIKEAREQPLSEKDIVLHRKSNRLQRFYYWLPGFIRRIFWRFLLSHPSFAFRKMGNVAITSVGMLGHTSGWFIPISVHPVCFGIGSVIKKPVVVQDKVESPEVRPISILFDSGVSDGGLMARFISDLSINMETGKEL